MYNEISAPTLLDTLCSTEHVEILMDAALRDPEYVLKDLYLNNVFSPGLFGSNISEVTIYISPIPLPITAVPAVPDVLGLDKIGKFNRTRGRAIIPLSFNTFVGVTQTETAPQRVKVHRKHLNPEQRRKIVDYMIAEFIVFDSILDILVPDPCIYDLSRSRYLNRYYTFR